MLHHLEISSNTREKLLLCNNKLNRLSGTYVRVSCNSCRPKSHFGTLITNLDTSYWNISENFLQLHGETNRHSTIVQLILRLKSIELETFNVFMIKVIISISFDHLRVDMVRLYLSVLNRYGNN